VFAEWLRTKGRKKGRRDPSEILVTDALNDYGTERAPKTKAPRVIGSAISALTSYWEGLSLADVTPHTCAEYVEKRRRSANTARRELAVLAAAVNWAYENTRLTHTVPVAPAKTPPKDRWLTKKEAAALLRASRAGLARSYLTYFILLSLYTGRRKEQILSLRWPQVDLEHGLIDFRRQGEAETKKRRGRVRVPDKLLAHLKRLRRYGTDLGYVVNDNGRHIGDIKKGFAAACERGGLVSVTPHTMKHTSITWAMQAGVKTFDAADYFATSEKILIEV
jgi:integrase